MNRGKAETIVQHLLDNLRSRPHVANELELLFPREYADMVDDMVADLITDVERIPDE